MQMITGHVVFMNFYPKLTDWIFSLTRSVPKCVIMRSASSFSNLLERGFSCVGPPVNLQVILTLKRFSARLTDEISDPCKKKDTVTFGGLQRGDCDRTGASS